MTMAELPTQPRAVGSIGPQYVAAGEHRWAITEPNWGIWSVPESEVRMFPGRPRGSGRD
jgi:hypothetical protein